MRTYDKLIAVIPDRRSVEDTRLRFGRHSDPHRHRACLCKRLALS